MFNSFYKVEYWQKERTRATHLQTRDSLVVQHSSRAGGFTSPVAEKGTEPRSSPSWSALTCKAQDERRTRGLLLLLWQYCENLILHNLCFPARCPKWNVSSYLKRNILCWTKLNSWALHFSRKKITKVKSEPVQTPSFPLRCFEFFSLAARPKQKATINTFLHKRSSAGRLQVQSLPQDPFYFMAHQHEADLLLKTKRIQGRSCLFILCFFSCSVGARVCVCVHACAHVSIHACGCFKLPAVFHSQ